MKETITLLRGDVDWIVMKRLEKDRVRRYETANGLASEIQRHLNNEAVLPSAKRGLSVSETGSEEQGWDTPPKVKRVR